MFPLKSKHLLEHFCHLMVGYGWVYVFFCCVLVVFFVLNCILSHFIMLFLCFVNVLLHSNAFAGMLARAHRPAGGGLPDDRQATRGAARRATSPRGGGFRSSHSSLLGRGTARSVVEGAEACEISNMRAPVLTQKRARSLRRSMTPPEAALWACNAGAAANASAVAIATPDTARSG